MFMFIGVEDRFMSSVVSLGVTGLLALSVATHKVPGSVDYIPGAFTYVLTSVNSVLTVRFFVGSAISVLK